LFDLFAICRAGATFVVDPLTDTKRTHHLPEALAAVRSRPDRLVDLVRLHFVIAVIIIIIIIIIEESLKGSYLQAHVVLEKKIWRFFNPAGSQNPKLGGINDFNTLFSKNLGVQIHCLLYSCYGIRII